LSVFGDLSVLRDDHSFSHFFIQRLISGLPAVVSCWESYHEYLSAFGIIGSTMVSLDLTPNGIIEDPLIVLNRNSDSTIPDRLVFFHLCFGANSVLVLTLLWKNRLPNSSSECSTNHMGCGTSVLPCLNLVM